MTEDLRAEKRNLRPKPENSNSENDADEVVVVKPVKKKKSSSIFSKIFLMFISMGILAGITGIAGIVFVLMYFGKDLPSHSHLKKYEPPIVTRVYSGDGRLLAEFATEKRVFTPIKVIPKQVIDAFLSAEDKNFYTHSGVDLTGVARAIVVNIQNIGKGRRLVGASTITQQVAKNFLLSNEASYERKIKEALLAFRLEKAFTKDQILELYMNEIYLGGGAYGVVAASLHYFNKSLNELSIEEAAFLAALPKAPNNYHPVKKYKAAFGRRNWVIDRMLINKHIEEAQADIAKAKPLKIVLDDGGKYFKASYFAEEIRRKIAEIYGDKSLYEGGLLVRSTVNPFMQEIAARALRKGLVDYDTRHGLHSKPITKITNLKEWQKELINVEIPDGAEDWKMAVILTSDNKKADIGFADGSKGIITFNKMKWARKQKKKGYLGPAVKRVSDVLKIGDVVLTEDAKEDVDGVKVYYFRQIPKVQGALVAMDPHTGRVLSMVGGFSYEISEFNRATQAKRQPGSAFKPIVYLTALYEGYTPATLVLDAPFVIDQGGRLGKWKPSNYSNNFYGPTPLRIGIEKSRNLMTVRLANKIGMDKVKELAERLGITENMPEVLSMSLGAGETTLMKMVTAYSMIVNGGKKVEPSVIDRIQDRHGKGLYVHDKRPCYGCGPLIPWAQSKSVPQIPDTRENVIDPRYAYQMTSIMEGVIQRGTGVGLKSLKRPIAGKTGTTNEEKDAWFIGFTPDLVVGVYIGFDDPKPMGKGETGGRLAVPVFKQFMKEALKDVPATPFRQPYGIRLVQVDANDGTRAMPGDTKVIWEAFTAGTEPSANPVMFDDGLSPILDYGNDQGSSGSSSGSSSVTLGTGGLY